MSQSDSDADLGLDDDDKPLYAYEKIYNDARDKADILAKPQIEREQIIASRTDEVDRHEQNRQLRQLVAAREREDRKQQAKAKRKAGDAGLDDSQRKSSRQRKKVGGDTSSRIENYKKIRAEKASRDELARQKRTRSLSPADDFEPSDDDHSDEYDRRPTKKRSPSPVKDDPPAELRELQRARIGRFNFGEICQTPGFEEAVTGCFARVNIGPDGSGVNVYRICEIVGIETGKPYVMPGPNRRDFLTEKWIVAAHGKAKKTWSFLECSMDPFTDNEWRRYRVTMANEHCTMPTQGHIAKKTDALQKLLNHKWTNEQISAKVQGQTDLYRKVTRAKEKEDIEDAIREATRTRNTDIIPELEEKLYNIVPMKLAVGTTLHKKEAPRANDAAERLAALNTRNDKANTEMIRKAQLAEMHARRVKMQQRTASPAPKKNLDDLFEGDSDISRAGTPVNGAGTPRAGTPGANSTANGTPRSGTPVLYKPVVKRKGIPVIRKAARDDEILATMDLGLEI
jgi:RNA polymerase-associated protein RTF1